MVKPMKLKIFLTFLACIIFAPAELYAFDVNSFADLEDAINNSQKSIRFMVSNIDYTRNLPSFIYGVTPIDFYGNVTLDGDNRYQIFNFKYDADITFHDDISFVNSTGTFGGAIYSFANINLENVKTVFSGNDAGSGGAIYFLGQNSKITIDKSTAIFSGNSAGSGGAIASNYSNITIENSLVDFSGNIARNSGGAIYSSGYTSGQNQNPNIVIENSTAVFSGNSANTNGGAIYAYSGSKINIENSRVDFSGNSAEDASGGAIYLTDGSIVTFTYSDVNFSGNSTKNHFGGAIAAYNNSKINTENARVDFFGNSAWYSGGAIALLDRSTSTFKNSDIYFTSNTANEYGGAIYLIDNSTAIFDNSNVYFSGNSANFGGAVYADNNSKIVAYNNTNITFFGNSATSGGAIYFDDSSLVTFTDSYVDFSGNSAASGGAISAYSNLNITVDNNARVCFSGNSAAYGGAIAGYRNSKIVANNARVDFSGNSATYGGAIYLSGDNNIINFNNSEITAIGNIAVSSGGFIYSQGNSNIDINLNTMSLMNNTAKVGGTFYGEDGTTFKFSAPNSKIMDSTASYAGGYMALGEDGTGDFSNTALRALGNSAENGGFMYLSGAKAQFGKSSFEDNEAKKGGAIAILNDAIIEFSGSEGIFKNNKATEYGGAIYAESRTGARATVSVLSGNLIFENNKANGANNDIYAGRNITFELKAAQNSAIIMGGGIQGVQNSAVIKTGLGKLTLLDNSVNEYYGEFRIEQGIVEVNENATAKFGKLNIESEGIYSVINNAAQVTETGEANIKGSMEIDVDLDNLSADILKATGSRGNVNLSGSSKLKLNLYGTASLGKSEITIIEADNRVVGEFRGDPFESLGYAKEIGGENPGVIYSENRVYIQVIKGTNFEKELGNMTHNQREVARSADKITATMASGKIRSEFLSMINRLNEIQSKEAKKRGMDELSGAIIANMLSAGAYGNGHEETFERIQPRTKEGEEEIFKSMWGHGYGYGQERDKDDNSVEEFSVSGYGIEAGADLLTMRNVVGGVYAGYEKSRGKQGESKGEVKEIGAGLYGGWFGENVDVKGRIYGGKLQYKINRELKLLEEKTESEIEAYNIKGDVLAQYNIWLRDNLSIMPYGHMKVGYVSNSGVREKGRGGANIEIYDGSYARMEWIAGVSVNYVSGKLSLYGRISNGYVMFGENVKYKGEFMGTGEEMEIWGATSGKLSTGVGAGAEYEITSNWSVYANVSENYYEGGIEYYGNIGLNYSFGTGKIYKEENILEETEATEKEISEEDIREIENEGELSSY
jgi:predicted outer membrane repeat protein